MDSEDLRETFEGLQREWEASREEWDDQQRVYFEKNFWSEWAPSIRRAVEALQELEASIDQAESVTD